jgi:hypothetical protein
LGAAPPAAECTSKTRLHPQAGFLHPAGVAGVFYAVRGESAAMPAITIRRRGVSNLGYTSNTPYRAVSPCLTSLFHWPNGQKSVLEGDFA